jgi:hypothetical protein
MGVKTPTFSAHEYARSIRNQQVPYFGYVKVPFTGKTLVWATGYLPNQFVMTEEDFYDSTPPNIITSDQLVEVLLSFREVRSQQFRNFLVIEGVE